MTDKTFKDIVDQIKDFYQDHDYDLGWRFLTCSKTVLKNNPKIALITLNPGGSTIPEDQPWASCEKGNAYLYEKWKKNKEPGKSPLQIQIRRMFNKIREKINYEGVGDELLESSLSAYFVPFRSRNLNDLKHQEEAFDFGEKIWRDVLKTVHPKRFICIDKKTAKRLRKIIEATYKLPESRLYKLPTYWSKTTNYTADISEFGSNAEVKLLRLPHLSTYKLFSSKNKKCKEKIDDILTQFCRKN